MPLKAVYVNFQGDLYEIIADIFGEIHKVFVYRDNCNSIAEQLDEETLPKEVFEEFQNKITKWYNI